MIDALETFFPMAHERLCDRLRIFHEHNPDVHFPFRHSVYPACTMNCGPQTVSFLHSDGSDYPGFPGSIHPFGTFDPAQGGHLIVFELMIFIRFPSGSLSLLSSSGMRHGNTPIREWETRYSFTQYVSGELMKWIAYGFKPAGDLTPADKMRLDEEAEESIDFQRARMSNFFRLDRDRLAVYERRRMHTAARSGLSGPSCDSEHGL